MKLRVGIAVIAIGTSLQTTHASDATSPIDYTRRNTPYAPQAGVTPAKQSPSDHRATVQDARVDKNVKPKESSSVGGRRAAIDVTEGSAKNVLEKNSDRPVALEQPKNAFNQRPAAISTAADTRKPPTVSRYQDSMAAASASNMARFPAIDAQAKATINRFVFRKNGSDAPPAPPAGTATPAAGGSPVRP